LYRLTRIIVELPIVAEDNTTYTFALQCFCELTAHNATGELDRFLASSMLVDDGGDDATEIIEA